MNPKFFRNGIVMLVLVIGTAALLFTWIQSTTPTTQIGYSQFLADVAADKVTSVEQQGDTLTVKVTGAANPYTVIAASTAIRRCHSGMSGSEASVPGARS